MNSLETGCLVLPHGKGHPVLPQAWPTPDTLREGELQHRAIVWCEACSVPDPGRAPSETLRLDLDSFILLPIWTLCDLPMSSEEENKRWELACRALSVLLQPACPHSALPNVSYRC